MNKFMLLFVYFSFLGEGLTLICYKCDSTKNEPCDDNFNTTVNCENEPGHESSSKSPECIKIRAKEGVTKAHKYIARGCTWFENCDIFGERTGFFGRIPEKSRRVTVCSTCWTDKCNSDTTTPGSVSLTMILTTVVLMFFNY